MKIAFGFDLHNTIVRSNVAWVQSLLLHSKKDVDKSYIESLVYKKVSRKKIAADIGADYDEVLNDYYMFIKPDNKIVTFIQELYNDFPLYLISSSSKEKVMRDLKTWEGEQYFSGVYTKETFCKGRKEDWERFLDSSNIDLMIYLGNDAEEDVIDCKRVLSLIHGDFLRTLSGLGLLSKRGGTYD